MLMFGRRCSTPLNFENTIPIANPSSFWHLKKKGGLLFDLNSLTFYLHALIVLFV